MKILWLGQAGLLLVSGRTKIMIDPYLSDSLSKHNHAFARRFRVNKRLFKVKPNAIVLTNSHSDHADVESIEKVLKRIRNKSEVTILSCKNVFDELVDIPTICQANNIMLEEGSEWTVDNLNICALPAKTDDVTAFSVVITDNEENKKYYIASDTLYNKYIFDSIPEEVYAAFLPINGTYGSMNLADAKRFASRINATYFVPYHFGLFDKIDASELGLENMIIPKPYKIIDFDNAETSSMRKRLNFKFNEKKKKEKKNAIIADDDIEAISGGEEATLPVNELAILPASEDTTRYDDADSDNRIEANITNDDISDNIDEKAVNSYSEANEKDTANEVSAVAYEDAYEESQASNEDTEAYGDFYEENSEYLEADKEEDNPYVDNLEYSYDDENSVADIPFEAGNWEEYVSGGTDDENEENSEDDEPTEAIANSPISHSSDTTDDDNEKIDAYIREIEKFERGETTDFSTVD